MRNIYIFTNIVHHDILHKWQQEFSQLLIPNDDLQDSFPAMPYSQKVKEGGGINEPINRMELLSAFVKAEDGEHSETYFHF